MLMTGQEPSDQVIEQMMSEAPGPLNFTMFLTLFGEKLTGKNPLQASLCLHYLIQDDDGKKSFVDTLIACPVHCPQGLLIYIHHYF